MQTFIEALEWYAAIGATSAGGYPSADEPAGAGYVVPGDDGFGVCRHLIRRRG